MVCPRWFRICFIMLWKCVALVGVRPPHHMLPSNLDGSGRLTLGPSSKKRKKELVGAEIHCFTLNPMADPKNVEALRSKRWKRAKSTDERTPLLYEKQKGEHQQPKRSRLSNIFHRLSEHWVPAAFEREDDCGRRVECWREIDRRPSVLNERNFRRRAFLFLTDPSSSFGSAVFFAVMIITIALSIVIMVIQTMEAWQYTPTDCIGCGGTQYYPFDGTFIPSNDVGGQCVCPPTPFRYTVVLEDTLVYFFSVEWFLRVLMFEPPTHDRANSLGGFMRQWFGFLISFSTILDALSIFPYFFTKIIYGGQSLLALRLVKLFRVFPLLRLGQFNSTFQSLINVLAKSLSYLRLLIVVLVFGSAFFGSLIYYLERGFWKYFEATETYEFVRVGADGMTEELSPFRSIPEAFWWFMVTATTVGYGDLYPTSVGGKIVASFAMLLGVLVIAFPVSVFSDLWSKELANIGAIPVDEEPRLDLDAARNASSKKKILMSEKDVETLHACLKSIEENQALIRALLIKYNTNA